MSTALITAVFSLGFAPAPFPGIKGDLKAVQGKWVPVRWTFELVDFRLRLGGRLYDSSMLLPKEQSDGTTVDVRGKVLSFRRGGVLGKRWTIEFKPRGKRLKIHSPGSKTPMLGIYSLEDRTLKICYTDEGGPRPTVFSAKGQWLLVLERPR